VEWKPSKPILTLSRSPNCTDSTDITIRLIEAVEDGQCCVPTLCRALQDLNSQPSSCKSDAFTYCTVLPYVPWTSSRNFSVMLFYPLVHVLRILYYARGVDKFFKTLAKLASS
jgi:hypothetical protein